MGSNSTKAGFTLPDEKINVQYIKRRRGMAAGDHIGEDHVIAGGMLLNSVKKYSLPIKRNGSLANVLTTEEKNYLEDITKLDLSIYSSFWNDYSVPLRKSKNTFDLSDPMDYISYKILTAYKDRIALKWEDRLKLTSYEFVVVKEGEELKATKKIYDTKKSAFKLYGKIEDDREQLLGVLKLLTNKPVSKKSKLEWVQTKVEEIIDESPGRFVSVMNDSSLATKLLIHEAVDLGVINKRSNKYTTADGLDLCEADEIPTFDNAVAYLNNDRNQEVRSLVEAKINNAK